VPFGVFRDIQKPSYEAMLEDQVQASLAKRGKGDLEKLLYSSDIWKVEAKASVAETLKKAAEGQTSEQNYWEEVEMARLLKAGGDYPRKDKLQKVIMGEKLSDFISKNPPIIVAPETTVKAMIEEMQANPTKGCVLVCDKDQKLVGIASIRDVLLKVAGKVKDTSKITVKDIMTPRPETLDKDAELSYALHKMSIGKFRHVPVLDGGRPVGVVSTRDLIEYLTQKKK
jgi:CBS domain-containing protein